MNIKIYKDEWYPVYSLSNTFGHDIQVSEDLFNRHEKIMAEFDDLQDELIKIYKELK